MRRAVSVNRGEILLIALEARFVTDSAFLWMANDTFHSSPVIWAAVAIGRDDEDNLISVYERR